MVDVSEGIIKSSVLTIAQELGCPDEHLEAVWLLMSTWEYPETPDLIKDDVAEATKMIAGR